MQAETSSNDMIAAVWGLPLLEHAPIGILAANAQGELEFANPKALQSLESAGISPAPGDSLLGIPLVAALLARIDLGEFFRRASPVTCHTVSQGGTRAAVTVDATLVPLYDSAEAPRGFLLYLQERSMQHEAERDVVFAEKYSALNTVIAGVAHELNNPLTAILGSSQFLMSKEQDEAIRRRLRSIGEETERCGKIVANLLCFSQRYRMVKAPTNINRLIEDTVSLCRYHIELDGILIKLMLDPAVPEVPVQALEMQRVFLSLINNAHHAMRGGEKRGGELTVRSCVVGGMLRVTFSDTGPGVPADIRHRIFDPFFTTRDLGDGMGLGLSVAYGVVRDHRGHLWLDTADNAGATFSLDLPLEEPREAGAGN